MSLNTVPYDNNNNNDSNVQTILNDSESDEEWSTYPLIRSVEEVEKEKIIWITPAYTTQSEWSPVTLSKITWGHLQSRVSQSVQRLLPLYVLDHSLRVDAQEYQNCLEELSYFVYVEMHGFLFLSNAEFGREVAENWLTKHLDYISVDMDYLTQHNYD
uniref:TIR domain-containing protein n=1 Tax=Caenorhabditis tropicalis TaxID=1561998 RepID=A0A1I7TRB9_9PELO